MILQIIAYALFGYVATFLIDVSVAAYCEVRKTRYQLKLWKFIFLSICISVSSFYFIEVKFSNNIPKQVIQEEIDSIKAYQDDASFEAELEVLNKLLNY